VNDDSHQPLESALPDRSPTADAHWEVIVIGAGAAGLVAAEAAAARGRKTLLLEKNRKPGVKILMSGGTRCNITHATDNRGIVKAFGPQGRFLHSPLAALSVDDTLAMFHAEGLATKVESTGKIFPVSDRATDVVAALLARLRRTDCTLALAEPVREIGRGERGFFVRTEQRALTCDSLLIAVGGQSYPGCGTAGDGYSWTRQLGHTIVTPRPALAPLTTDMPWVRELQGITIPDTAVRLIEPASEASPKQRVWATTRGSFLFTHFGLSGPVPLDVSRWVSGHPRPRTLTLECDFLPTLSFEPFEALLAQQTATAGRKQLSGLIPAELPSRLVDALLAHAQLPPQLKAAEAGPRARRQAVEAIKQAKIALTGTRGFKQAEVTAGGVALDEVDSRTMQSKLVPGLFLAGEVLDLDGPIGGYNFQAAWSTGYLAGQNL